MSLLSFQYYKADLFSVIPNIYILKNFLMSLQTPTTPFRNIAFCDLKFKKKRKKKSSH